MQWTLGRIANVSQTQGGINAVREVSGQALDEAALIDSRLARGEPLGALVGVPVLLKDNILVGDGQRTSAGAAALADFRGRRDATIVTRLRAAGAIIVGKCNMTEFADYVSDTMPAGFSGIGGMVVNPHTGEPYGRGQGSSVGSAAAVAADLVPLAIGTETQNSLQAPACHSSVVAVKPSVGLVSRAGVVPLVPSQDSPGPIVRNVADATLALQSLAGPDCRDTATLAMPRGVASGEIALSALRIGVPRRAISDRPEVAEVLAQFEVVLSLLARGGAQIVDPCEIPSAATIMDLRSCVFRTEFKASLDAFLDDHDEPCGIGSLAALIAWNDRHPDCVPFGQSLLVAAATTDGLGSAEYRQDRAQDIALSGPEGIDAALSEHRADILLVPMACAAKITGKAGAPVVALPAGADANGRPFGITAIASHGNDARLLQAAAAIEGALERGLGPRMLPQFPNPT
ncbi:amidase family protein [Mesorhizobium sp. 8]|uniref:amidase family protein n=1 Tax=Mesorhizobium sp. 8 TaxID=2584466 RepID=UPI0015D6766E|nr:amidase family protein [Mesorhizobium sp. 8]